MRKERYGAYAAVPQSQMDPINFIKIDDTILIFSVERNHVSIDKMLPWYLGTAA
jgi:hypothetical protein